MHLAIPALKREAQWAENPNGPAVVFVPRVLVKAGYKDDSSQLGDLFGASAGGF